MGWLDYHLHEFLIIAPHSRKPVTIGIPASDFSYDNDDVLRGSECAIADYSSMSAGGLRRRRRLPQIP